MIEPVMIDRSWNRPNTPPPSTNLDAWGCLALPENAGPVAALPVIVASDVAPSIMVRDPAMAELMHRIEHMSPSNANVLITGEHGTGKGLVAAHLHQGSSRYRRAFVVLNCAAIHHEMLDSELFGHEEGAFRDAPSCRIGKFEAATGGTLLLDEIGEMNQLMQAKVLRAVQEREIDRIGGRASVPIDVRIISTSSRNMLEEVHRGRFRADLFFRLNVLTLKVPPLRDRPADIPALAEFFARKIALANGRPAMSVSPEGQFELQQHMWPGNVRELENVMHRAVLTETGASITASSLDIDASTGTEDACTIETSHSFSPPTAMQTTGRTIEAVEKDMILDTLRQCKGNRSQTATVLGISIRTLRNKLHEYEQGGTRIPRPVVIAMV